MVTGCLNAGGEPPTAAFERATGAVASRPRPWRDEGRGGRRVRIFDRGRRSRPALRFVFVSRKLASAAPGSRSLPRRRRRGLPLTPDRLFCLVGWGPRLYSQCLFAACRESNPNEERGHHHVQHSSAPCDRHCVLRLALTPVGPPSLCRACDVVSLETGDGDGELARRHCRCWRRAVVVLARAVRTRRRDRSAWPGPSADSSRRAPAGSYSSYECSFDWCAGGHGRWPAWLGCVARAVCLLVAASVTDPRRTKRKESPHAWLARTPYVRRDV
jgi:hypothetical protein